MVSGISGVVFVDFSELFKFYWYCSTWAQISLTFLFDELCLFMFLLVIGVSLTVHVYSIEYMADDPNRNLFLGYLSLFTSFMLLLVSAGNFIQFFVGWEGIGLCSYLLINFWYMRVEANLAAIKAVVVNKIGDCAFVIGVGLVYYYFYSFNFVTVTSVIGNYLDFNFGSCGVSFFYDSIVLDSATLVALFFLIAVMGKSAQIGLHT